MFVERLMRRIKWLLIHQWKTLTLEQWPYETCQDCGKPIRTVWHSDQWDSVVSGGCLCVDCFVKRAEELKVCKPDITVEAFQPDI